MRTPWIVLTGLAAVAPIASMVAVPILWSGAPPENYEATRVQADAFHNFVLGLIVAVYLITGFFMLLAFRSKAVPTGKRGLWAALLFFGNALVFPVFWYWYIWRTRPSDEVTAST